MSPIIQRTSQPLSNSVRRNRTLDRSPIYGQNPTGAQTGQKNNMPFQRVFPNAVKPYPQQQNGVGTPFQRMFPNAVMAAFDAIRDQAARAQQFIGPRDPDLERRQGVEADLAAVDQANANQLRRQYPNSVLNPQNRYDTNTPYMAGATPAQSYRGASPVEDPTGLSRGFGQDSRFADQADEYAFDMGRVAAGEGVMLPSEQGGWSMPEFNSFNMTRGEAEQNALAMRQARLAARTPQQQAALQAGIQRREASALADTVAHQGFTARDRSALERKRKNLSRLVRSGKMAEGEAEQRFRFEQDRRLSGNLRNGMFTPPSPPQQQQQQQQPITMPGGAPRPSDQVKSKASLARIADPNYTPPEEQPFSEQELVSRDILQNAGLTPDMPAENAAAAITAKPWPADPASLRATAMAYRDFWKSSQAAGDKGQEGKWDDNPEGLLGGYDISPATLSMLQDLASTPDENIDNWIKIHAREIARFGKGYTPSSQDTPKIQDQSSSREFIPYSIN